MAHKTSKNQRPQGCQHSDSLRHSVWEATHAAGLTHFGRPLKVGGVMGAKRSKGAKDKRACRGRHGGEE